MSIPSKLYCAIGGEEKPWSAFSASQIHKLRQRARNGEVIDSFNAGISCHKHYTAEEKLECARCGQVRGISQFSKTSRKRDDPECRQCVAWVEIQEYEVVPIALPSDKPTDDERASREMENKDPRYRVVDHDMPPIRNGLDAVGGFIADEATADNIANTISMLHKQASKPKTKGNELPSHLQTKPTKRPAELPLHLQEVPTPTQALPSHLRPKAANLPSTRDKFTLSALPPHMQPSGTASSVSDNTVATASPGSATSQAASWSSSAWTSVAMKNTPSVVSTDTEFTAIGSDVSESTLQTDSEWQTVGKRRKVRSSASAHSANTTASSFRGDDLLGDWNGNPPAYLAQIKQKSKSKFR